MESKIRFRQSVIAMHCFLSSCIFYVHVVLVFSIEDLDYSWLPYGDVSGLDNVASTFNSEGAGLDDVPTTFNSEDGSLFSNDQPLGDETWDLNEEPSSQASFPLKDTQPSDLAFAPDSSFDNEDYAMILENPPADHLDDPPMSDDECHDLVDLPVGGPQPRSTDAGSDICALRREGDSSRNVPSNLKLQDVQRIPGFEPIFRGMSDSCIIYSDGRLPFGVCSSAEPEDSVYAAERFFGMLTWQLVDCTLGKFFHILSWSLFLHFGWLAGWREHEIPQVFRLMIRLTATQRHREYLRATSPPNFTAAVTGSRVRIPNGPITACRWMSWYFSVPASNEHRHRFRSDGTRCQPSRKKHLQMLPCFKRVPDEEPQPCPF